jgi:ABC-type uncharacterized transport system auxiliary subunit
MRWPSALVLIAALAVAAALAACGSGEEQEATAATETQVTVVIRPQGSPDNERRTLIQCPKDKRCDRIEKADFSPPDDKVACTQIYGGKATALLTGRIKGEQVDADFDLHDGCAINRWQDFSWLLGDPPSS